MSMRAISPGDLLRSAAISSGIFVLLGTVAALWSNPFFMRMTPTSGFETVVLAAQAVMAGLYLGISRPRCASKTAGTGGVLGFLGVACPVCNKLLLWTFGSALLLEYFEPVRIYVGLAGAALLAYALWRKLFVDDAECVGVAATEIP
jgi:hypothetical protein